MMSRLVLLMLMCATFLFGQDSKLTKRIDSLAVFADGFPPNVRDSVQLKRVVVFYDSIVTDLLAFESNHPDDPELLFTIGEVFRMGHNLDAKGAWSNSEKYLKRAMSLQPSNWRSYQSLGLLYVNSDMTLAPQAEQLFLKAIELSGDNPAPILYHSLAFSFYYQGKLRKCREAFKIYLNAFPDDERVARMIKFIDKKLNE